MEKKDEGLSSWQLTMMALGSVIGGSFFLGSSVAIHSAGPSVLISFILGGILVYFILFALSEMTVASTETGSFRSFATHAFGNGTGFVVGWVYWTGLVLGMSSEASAISILVREWIPKAPIWVLGSVIIIGVTALNLLGTRRISKFESNLAAIKLFALILFIVTAIVLIAMAFLGKTSAVATPLSGEALMPGGIKSIAGSMLIVIFAYAGFEVIGLAASEATNPTKTIPRAIRHTVFILLCLYILSVAVILLLIPTSDVNVSISPMVAVLNRHGIAWAGTVLNIVLITAILSTMLAVMFGLGRMIRSLADEGMAPNWLKDKQDIPYRGILFSGFGMLAGLGIGLFFPNVYLFLISSGGFAILFTYAIIMATHIRLRKKYGCPPDGKCQIRGYPYTSYMVLIILVIAIFSMPFIPGQASGLIAGCIMVAFHTITYMVMKFYEKRTQHSIYKVKSKFSTEFSKEISETNENENDKDKH